jgi:hypothetical protein
MPGAAASQCDRGRSAGRTASGASTQLCSPPSAMPHTPAGAPRCPPSTASRATPARRARPHRMGTHVLLPPLDIMQNLPYRFCGAASSPIGDRAPHFVRLKRPRPTPSNDPCLKTAVSRAADTSRMEQRQRPVDAAAKAAGVRSVEICQVVGAPARLTTGSRTTCSPTTSSVNSATASASDGRVPAARTSCKPSRG